MTAPGNYNANVVLSADIGQYQQGMQSATQSTQQTQSAVEKLGSSLGRLKERSKDRLVTYDRASIATLAAATASAALFQKQLSTLNATAAVTGTSMKSIKAGIENAFVKLPVARSDLVQLANTLNQLGVTSGREIGNMIVTFEKLAAVTGGSATGLAASMTQFTNAMGDMSASNVKTMSNSLVNLSKSAGLSAQSILDFSQAIAPIARVAGITENQVLGLSTAFNKAGANGYVAANTFNSMLQDITQLSSTGAPGLAKYANVLGLTVAQFNNLPRAQAVAELFQTINSQGAQGINTLNTLGINGVRAITALQSVVQSGNLNQYLQGGSTTNNALNKGAKAAFGNLADQLAVTRNEMTQYGTYIGTTFIGPLTLAAKAVNGLVRALGFLKPFLAVPVAAAGLASSILGPVMGFVAPLVAMRWLRQGPVGRGISGGFRGARLVGQMNGEAPTPEQMGRIAALRARGIETDPLRITSPLQRFGYRLGATPGSAFQRVAESDVVASNMIRGVANQTLSMPFRAVRAIANANTTYYRNSMAEGGYGTPTLDRAINSVAGAPSSLIGRFRQARLNAQAYQSVGEDHPFVKAARESVAGGGADNGKVWEDIKAKVQANSQAFLANSKAQGTEGKAAAYLAEQAAAAAKALAVLTGTTVKASASAAMSALGAIPGGKILGGVGKFGGGLIKDLMGTPLGAVMTGGMIGMAGFSMYKGEAKKSADWQDFLNPIQKYNDQLGIASTELANFSQNLKQSNLATQNLAPKTMGAAAQVTDADVQGAPKKPTTSLFKSIGKSNTQGALSLLQSMPVTSPSQLQAIKEDMLASGFDRNQVQQIMSTYTEGGTNVAGLGNNVDYAGLAKSVAKTEGKGMSFALGPTRSKKGKQISADVLSGIDVQNQADAMQYGSQYAGYHEVSNTQQYFGGLLAQMGNAGGQQRDSLQEEIARSASKLTGGGYGGYNSSLGSGKVVISQDMTSSEQATAFFQLLKSTAEGRSFLKQNGITDDILKNPSQLQGLMDKSMTTPTNMAQIRAVGPLGQFAANNSLVQQAIGSQQGNPNIISAASTQMLSQALSDAHGNAEKAAESLQKVADASGDLTGPFGQLVLSAKQAAQAMTNVRAPLYTPQQSVTHTATAFQTALNADPHGPDFGANVQKAYGDMQSAGVNYLGYLKNLAKQIQGFNNQITDSNFDMGNQVAHAWRDYQRQVEYSNQDFQRSVLHSTRDFNISMERQAQQSAQSIYNPFLRVQAQYTTDSGTLIQNLEDQNARIQKQMDQLRALRKRGLSQQSIDTLDLANPANAQQLNNLSTNMSQQQINQINKDVQKRLTATTSLTQSTFSMQFRNTTADFRKGMNDAASEFQITMTRAALAQSTSMDDMAKSFSYSMDRAKRDMNESITDLGDNTKGIVKMINDQMGILKKTAPDVATTLTNQAKAVQNVMPWLTSDAMMLQMVNQVMGELDALAQQGAAAASRSQAKKNEYGAGQDLTGAGPTTTTPWTPGGAVYGNWYGPGGTATTPGHASGGISTYAHMASISEQNKSEAIIPLDMRGQQFMVGMYNAVAKSVYQQQLAGRPGGTAVSTVTKVYVDHSTNINGPISVQANDTKKLLAEIQRKARINKLARPQPSTAGNGT